MSFRKPRIAPLLAAASATLLLQAPAALAINFGDMMSPGRWMGGNNDDDDYYDYRGYGPNVPPPGVYGAPPYAAPYGAYGPTPYGGAYGAPYGAPPAWAPSAAPAPAPSPVTTPPPAARAAPAAPAAPNAKSNEIEALKRRIEELEGRKAPPPAYAPPPPPPGADRGAKPSPATGMGGPSVPAASAPTFRPMDKN